jgi:hypothetical protein
LVEEIRATFKALSWTGMRLRRDATTDFSDEHMHAALGVNLANYVNAIVTTKEVVDSLPSLKPLGMSAQS